MKINEIIEIKPLKTIFETLKYDDLDVLSGELKNLITKYMCNEISVQEMVKEKPMVFFIYKKIGKETKLIHIK